MSIVTGSPIIPSDRDGRCAMCREDFIEEDERLTHEDANHDPFHKECLVNWVNAPQSWENGLPTCPYGNHTPIDPSSLMSKADQRIVKLRPTLANAVYAFCGAAAVVTALAGMPTVAAKAAEGVTEEAAGVVAKGAMAVVAGITAGLSSVIMAGKDAEEGVVTAIGAGMIAGASGLGGAAGMAAAAAGIIAGASGIATGAAVGVAAGIAVGAASVLAGIATGAVIEVAAIGIAIGLGVNLLLAQQAEVDDSARQNIALGMSIAMLSMLALGVVSLY
jgi:hypothetical protein